MRTISRTSVLRFVGRGDQGGLFSVLSSKVVAHYITKDKKKDILSPVNSYK